VEGGQTDIGRMAEVCVEWSRCAPIPHVGAATVGTFPARVAAEATRGQQQ
jgi:hypothetical protein